MCEWQHTWGAFRNWFSVFAWKDDESKATLHSNVSTGQFIECSLEYSHSWAMVRLDYSVET